MKLFPIFLASLFAVAAFGQEAQKAPAPAEAPPAVVPAPAPPAESAPPKEASGQPKKLSVAVRNIEPFCFEEDGRRKGYAIDLWAAIAKDCGFQYDARTVNSAQAMVDDLAAKKADVGIGALSITSQRQMVIDFSHPFYDSGFDILTSTKGHNSAFHLLRLLLNPDLLKTLGLLFIAVLVVSHLLWLFERHRDDEEFPGAYKHGIFESLWWTTTVMVTLACDNKSPRGVPGRLVGLVWMISGVLLVSFMTASFSSSLTVSSLEGGINTPKDLAGHKVGTVAGSTAERYLNEHKITSKAFPNAAEACEAVSKGDMEAVVYDAPILRYQMTKITDKDLRVTGTLFEKQGYGIGLQPESPYRKQINASLLKLIENDTLSDLDKKWFGESTSDKPAEKK
jgi:polar amino acid transport system substrate-binding protein